MIKRKKAVAICLASFAATLIVDCDIAIAQNSNSKRTKWELVDKSLTELLNDGWKLINQSTNRAAIPNSVTYQTGGSTNHSGYDEETFTFMLSKNDKYVICLLIDPNLANGTYSRCRSLN